MLMLSHCCHCPVMGNGRRRVASQGQRQVVANDLVIVCVGGMLVV